MRKGIVAGNWKMNLSRNEGYDLVRDIVNGMGQVTTSSSVVLAAPAPFLAPLAKMLAGNDGIFLAAQNCSEHDNGAYTGEVSASILSSFEVSHVILGHSERRQYFEEDDVLIGKKIAQVLKHNMTPIYCFGETLQQRDEGQHKNVVTDQIKVALASLSNGDMNNLIIAYEPVWAIGTGRTASPEQAQEIHAHVRGLMGELFGEEGRNVSILYGGSCKPSNANELFGMPDIDGGLIGGASLKAEDFIEIIKANRS